MSSENLLAGAQLTNPKKIVPARMGMLALDLAWLGPKGTIPRMGMFAVDW